MLRRVQPPVLPRVTVMVGLLLATSLLAWSPASRAEELCPVRNNPQYVELAAQLKRLVQGVSQTETALNELCSCFMEKTRTREDINKCLPTMPKTSNDLQGVSQSGLGAAWRAASEGQRNVFMESAEETRRIELQVDRQGRTIDKTTNLPICEGGEPKYIVRKGWQCVPLIP